MSFLKFLSPRDYPTVIRPMIERYYETMHSLSSTLARNPSGPQLDISNEPLGFYMTNADFDRVKNGISNAHGFSKYLMLFAFDDKGCLTVCMVGVDGNGNILSEHKSGSLNGEETWPPSDQTLSLSKAEHNAFIGADS